MLLSIGSSPRSARGKTAIDRRSSPEMTQLEAASSSMMPVYRLACGRETAKVQSVGWAVSIPEEEERACELRGAWCIAKVTLNRRRKLGGGLSPLG